MTAIRVITKAQRVRIEQMLDKPVRLASLDGERTIVSLPDGRFHQLNKSELEYFQSAPAAPPGTTVG